MHAPSTGTRGIVQSLTWRWQGHAAVPAIETLCISPQPIPAGRLPTKPSMPAAPASLTMAPSNENKTFLGLERDLELN